MKESCEQRKMVKHKTHVGHTFITHTCIHTASSFLLFSFFLQPSRTSFIFTLVLQLAPRNLIALGNAGQICITDIFAVVELWKGAWGKMATWQLYWLLVRHFKWQERLVLITVDLGGCMPSHKCHHPYPLLHLLQRMHCVLMKVYRGVQNLYKLILYLPSTKLSLFYMLFFSFILHL